MRTGCHWGLLAAIQRCQPCAPLSCLARVYAYSLYPASVTTKQGLCEEGRSSEHRSHVEPRGIHLLEHTAATGTRMSITICEEMKAISISDRCQRQEHSREAILTRPNSQPIEERARSSENVQSPVRCCLVCCLFDPDCCQSSGRTGQQEPFRRGQGRSEVRNGRRHCATGVPVAASALAVSTTSRDTANTRLVLSATARDTANLPERAVAGRAIWVVTNESARPLCKIVGPRGVCAA
jgi:hypothetical protein